MRNRAAQKTGRDDFYLVFIQKPTEDSFCTACEMKDFGVKIQKEDQNDCSIVFRQKKVE